MFRTALISVCLICSAASADTPVVNEEFKLTANDGALSDQFGYSVSIDSDTALIGAKWDSDNGDFSGSAYIFRFNGSTWEEETKLLASDGTGGGDNFGWSVSISGNIAVIGARYDSPSGYRSGSAYIFRLNGSTWVEEAKLSASNGSQESYFGYAVSISGDRVVIGARGGAGSAYIYKFDGTNWNEEAILVSTDGVSEDWFGYRVSISDNTVIVGATQEDDFGDSSGSAYIYRFNGSAWVEEIKLHASDAASLDRFGSDVSIFGETAVVGSRNDDDNGTDSGSAYIYRFDGISWEEETKLLASDGMATDRFGDSVSISGNRIIIGAFSDDTKGESTGSAYLYRFDGSSWVEESKFLASDGMAFDSFGHSVSISDNLALVGAYADDDAGLLSGSAYIFYVGEPADTDGDGVLDSLDNCYLYNPDQADCNGNGIGDVCDLADFTSPDCDQNGVPDECQMDCDGDGWIDPCDNDSDIDQDGIPDNCEVDCNSNGLPDHFELELGLADDCNGNLIPDECDISDGQELDCNDNGVPDTCEVTEGTVEDCDENGIPDTCEMLYVFQQEAKLLPSDGEASGEFGRAVAIFGDIAVIGSAQEDANGQDGSAYIYQFDDNEWIEQEKLYAQNGSTGAFSKAVSISGDTVLIGAYGSGSSWRGEAYVFRLDGDTWSQEAKLLASDGVTGDWLGLSVSISGHTALVGAHGNDDNGANSGSAYVFRFDGSNWIEEAKLIPSDCSAADYFGREVSIDGDTAVISSKQDDDNGSISGSAYIFRFNGKQWIEEAKLLASDGTGGDKFGSSVSISDDTVIIGASDDDANGLYTGSAYIYRFDGNQWIEEAKLNASAGIGMENFGWSVSISDDTAIVGTQTDFYNNFGQAYIFRFNGKQWIEESTLLANEGALGDRFGSSVSISHDTVIIGASGNDENGSSAGSAYIFRGSTLLDCNENGLMDFCEVQEDSSLDCNDNGLIDICEIQENSSLDCNENGIPDCCDLQDPANDQNNNDQLDVCECLADTTGPDGSPDGIVGIEDLLNLIGFWETSNPAVDFDFNGIVDVEDLLTIITSWGECELEGSEPCVPNDPDDPDDP